ncbi:MAG: HepT-like ribonuclease domain-containing protein [Chloroflexota bacterium]
MRPDKLYLAEMVDAAEAIAEFIADFEADEFYRDHKTQSAVLQKLIVIGEAAARLSDEFRTHHSHIEWQDIIAFRNILVHAYFSVQLV